jgi:hypothetical protein
VGVFREGGGYVCLCAGFEFGEGRCFFTSYQKSVDKLIAYGAEDRDFRFPLNTVRGSGGSRSHRHSGHPRPSCA